MVLRREGNGQELLGAAVEKGTAPAAAAGVVLGVTRAAVVVVPPTTHCGSDITETRIRDIAHWNSRKRGSCHKHVHKSRAYGCVKRLAVTYVI